MADNGKTGQTVQIINNVIKTGGSSNKAIVKVFERDGGGRPPSPDCKKTPKPARCPPGEDPRIENPTAEGCESTPPASIDPCEEDRTAEGCPDPEPIRDPDDGDEGDGGDGGGDEEATG